MGAAGGVRRGFDHKDPSKYAKKQVFCQLEAESAYESVQCFRCSAISVVNLEDLAMRRHWIILISLLLIWLPVAVLAAEC